LWISISIIFFNIWKIDSFNSCVASVLIVYTNIFLASFSLIGLLNPPSHLKLSFNINPNVSQATLLSATAASSYSIPFGTRHAKSVSTRNVSRKRTNLFVNRIHTVHGTTDSIPYLPSLLDSICHGRDSSSEVTTVGATGHGEPLWHLPIAWIKSDADNLDKDVARSEGEDGNILAYGENVVYAVNDCCLGG
jgi:hypothetical protein